MGPRCQRAISAAFGAVLAVGGGVSAEGRLTWARIGGQPAQSDAGPRVEPAVGRRTPTSRLAAWWWFSVREDVFVIWGRVHIVTRFVGVGTRGARRRQAGLPTPRLRQAGGRVVPSTQVPEDSFDDEGVINDGDHPHRVLANGAAKRINVPHAQNQVAPALGGELHRRRWRDARAAAH